MDGADLHRLGSLRRNNSSIWTNGTNNVFSRSNHAEDDEEALRWATLEKLPTYDRLRKGILTGDGGELKEVDIKSLGYQERKILLDRLINIAEEDNEKFLWKLKNRIDQVGVEIPTIEVRFEHLKVDAEAYVGSRGLPSVFNFALNLLEEFMNFLRILPSKKRTLSVLNDVSGIIKPCRMTLLLGPPGSGKTTLLLALAGKLTSDLKASGRVTYNGHEMHEFIPERTAAYISQHDLHIGEMTVRETLEFSARCQGVGTRYEMLAEMSRREKEAKIKPDPDIDIFMKAAALQGQEANVVTDYILKILGLEICADTLVGDEMLRGISGGQKKRVTTGEMLVGPAKALFMDEISTGLDSSTTFQIVKAIRQSIHILSGTALISLLQPAPETYDLFDDVILLSDGMIVYQGPREHVLEFFESMGFKCPGRKGVADFLQEVTSRKDQEQYWMHRDQPYRYVSVKAFAEAFPAFHVGKILGEELATPFDKSKSHPAALTTDNYGASTKYLLKACIDRELLLMKRNSFAYIFKMFQLSSISIIAMTVFLRTEMHRDTLTDGIVFLGALFFGLFMLMFNGYSEMAMTVMKLPVFYKQRDFLFYPSWAYSLPMWVLKIPMSFVEAGIWVFITYYVIGFDPNVGRMFRQYLLLLCINQMASALFRFIAAVGRNMIVANTFGTFVLVQLVLMSGFLLSREDMKKWWIWGYWSSPLTYGLNALAVNEFRGKSWEHILPGTTEPLGILVLKTRGLLTSTNRYWIGVGALLGYTVVLNGAIPLVLSYLNHEAKMILGVNRRGKKILPGVASNFQATTKAHALINGMAVAFGRSQSVLSEEALKEKHANRTGEINGLPSQGESSFIHTTLESRSNEISRNLPEDSIDAAGNRKKGMVLPFEPLSIAFNDIKYSVDMPQEMKAQGVTEDRLMLLKGITGAFRPGVLTALMGVSGAGKTTLMDVLAGRKTGGYIEGSITISGYPKKQETFTRISGYCEQNDIHSPYVTVYESLLYSAWLRLPAEVDSTTRKMFIEEVMELVELTSFRRSLVGLPGVNGLSTEQRKRLTIAVELVANPSIIFMDEPTSGLDARAAAIVMRTVRNTVNTGRTVVCTIHQPSIDIFEAFDELFLLKRGGEEIFAGPLGHNSCQLISYFEGINGVVKIKDGSNPATWMLEVTTEAQEEALGVDFADIYKNSDQFRRTKALVEELSKPPPDSTDLHFPSQHPRSFITQCMACLWKQHKSYWRNTEYSAVRLLFTIFTALIFGTVFWDLGSKTNKQQDLFNSAGSLYIAVIFLGVQNSSSIQPVVAVERTVFYRERGAGMYSALPYAFGQVTIEIPYVLVQTLLYGLIVYSMNGYEWTGAKFFSYLFIMYFTLLYFTFYGMMAIAMAPNQQVSAISSAAFYAIWNLFSGFIIPRPNLPIWWRWYYWACPVAWSLYGLVTSQFGDVEDVLMDTGETVKEFLRSYFGYKHDFLGLVALMIPAFAVLFGLIFAFAIRMFNFQKR